MELGMIGLGRMGTKMVRRLRRAGIESAPLTPGREKASGTAERGYLHCGPAPVLSAALFERFASRGVADFADKMLSALRYAFGGHEEKADASKGGAR